MRRPIAACLMCVGLFTLGVTALKGQEDNPPPNAGVDEARLDPALLGTDAELVDIEIGSDDGIDVDGDVIIHSRDGRTVEKLPRAGARPPAGALRAFAGAPIDPAA